MLTGSLDDDLERAFAELTRAASSDTNPLRLGHHVGPPATKDRIATAWPDGRCRPEIAALWTTTETADLFIDLDFGQWGLRLLSPEASAARTRQELSERPGDFRSGDVILGEFLGDQELLVVEGGGGVRVAWPLDPRPDWPRPADDLVSFLRRYAASGGDKYWEGSQRVG